MIYNFFTSKRKEKIIIPDSWEKVTIGQFEQMAVWDGKDLLKLFSILSGIEVSVLENTYDPALEQQLLEACNFVYNPIDLQALKRPDRLTINGKSVKLPTDLPGLTIGQNILVYQEMRNHRVYEELISFATAVFIQPAYDGTTEFNYDRAKELEVEIKKMPLFEIYPVGFFLLKPRTSFGMTFMRIVRNTLRTLSGIFTKKGKALQKMQN